MQGPDNFRELTQFSLGEATYPESAGEFASFFKDLLNNLESKGIEAEKILKASKQTLESHPNLNDPLKNIIQNQSYEWIEKSKSKSLSKNSLAAQSIGKTICKKATKKLLKKGQDYITKQGVIGTLIDIAPLPGKTVIKISAEVLGECVYEVAAESIQQIPFEIPKFTFSFSPKIHSDENTKEMTSSSDTESPDDLNLNQDHQSPTEENRWFLPLWQSSSNKKLVSEIETDPELDLTQPPLKQIKTV